MKIPSPMMHIMLCFTTSFHLPSYIKKVAIACAVATFTSIEFYINISINEMLDYADEIGKMQDKSTKS